MESYVPKSKHAEVDGAAFGSSLPLMFLMTYPSFAPTSLPKYFDPKIFGFRAHGLESVVLQRLRKMEEERKPVVGVARQLDSDSF